jgi:hypothetical protein
MATLTQATAVNTAVVQILGQQAFAEPGTETVILSNLGTNSVFYGGSNVTSTTGNVLLANASIVIPATIPGGIWAVSITGPNTVVVGTY